MFSGTSLFIRSAPHKLCKGICYALSCCCNAISSMKIHVIYSSIIHYNDVTMTTMAYQITRLMIVYSTVYSGTDQRKHQSSALLAFVRGIRRWPANSPHKGPVTRKIFPFGDVIMLQGCFTGTGNILRSQRGVVNVIMEYMGIGTHEKYNKAHRVQHFVKSLFDIWYFKWPLILVR